MDSILISPKTEKELQYVLELLHTLEIDAKKISEADRDDFELAQLLKNVDASGIVREETQPIKLNAKQVKLLEQSESEMAGKTVVPEKVIQVEEDEWLSK
ncbi:hypothetical protein N7E81_07065 [Reichenbachiella carrageenanivorans]|uniref:Aspartyl/glutamyl-tRNA(Asn/Gln) amidotransferase subunit C n=1 Tax=Reichenbachiella carrageenanivorans TaxID=2979869 RepID=A0ABY6D429_9BACT|nr:hypothetical protein [Reichenbachiella carrageenanivorans]UXX80858.1 hypothetical protein N7E81_07065 [Reichenbachiella carrageenanivorans]